MSTQRILERWNRFAASRRLLLDAVLGALIAVVAVLPGLFQDLGERLVWRVVIGLIACAAVAFRRTRPDAAGLTIAAVAAVHLVVDNELSPAVAIAGLIGLYSMAAYGSVRGTRAALVLGVCAALAASGRFFGLEDGPSYEYNLAQMLFLAAFAAGVWAAGMLRRARIREVETLRERARLLELERAQEAELAAVGERTRIAREMHDIIAHTLTVVIAQADGGRYAGQTDPAAAARALETIADNGRQALADMRALLGVLREDGPRDTRAMPGIADLPDLIATVRSGGLLVGYGTQGRPRDVSVGCGLTTYRIVQESLTNILKHAGDSAHADVRLQWGQDELVITVTDDGRGGDPVRADGGKGVLGMRERAELHGGTLTVGNRIDQRGFQVRASLPVGEVR